MFTGIIEGIGIVKDVIINGSNHSYWIESPISHELKADQSVSHDGVCLTVEEVVGNRHRMTAVEETLSKTNLGNWRTGTIVNLERSVLIGDRLDGHIVQGHIDTTGICTKITEKNGSRVFTFEFPKKYAPLLVEKGSICLNGISLTVFEVKKKSFSVTHF